MITLERALAEYEYRLRRLVAARQAWKQDPNLVTLLTYLLAVETMNTRTTHANILRTIDFPDTLRNAS